MMLVARLRQLDADVFVGHNFAAFHLDVLLHRLQHHKVKVGQSAAYTVSMAGLTRHCIMFWLHSALFFSRAFSARLFAMLVAVPLPCSPRCLMCLTVHLPCPGPCRCPIGAAWDASNAAASPAWAAAASNLAAALAPALCQVRGALIPATLCCTRASCAALSGCAIKINRNVAPLPP